MSSKEEASAAKKGGFVREWLWQNGALAAVILFGVWVILGLYRLNLSIKEVGSFLLNAPGELRASAESLKRDIKEAERVAGELRRKTESIDAEMQASVLKDRLASAQTSAYKMSEATKKGLDDAQEKLDASAKALESFSGVEARLQAALAAATKSEAAATESAARIKKASEAAAKLEASNAVALAALDKDITELRTRAAELKDTLETLAATAAKIDKDLAKSGGKTASKP